eukprot:2621767-Prymnesium_polylepis.2
MDTCRPALRFCNELSHAQACDMLGLTPSASFQKTISLAHPFGSGFDEAIAATVTLRRRPPEPTVIHYLQGADSIIEPLQGRLRPHDRTRHQRRLMPRATTYFENFSPRPITTHAPLMGRPPVPGSDPYLRGRTFDRRAREAALDDPHKWLTHSDRSMDEVQRAARFGIMLDRRAQSAYMTPPVNLEVVERSYNPSWHNSRSVIKPGGWQ